MSEQRTLTSDDRADPKPSPESGRAHEAGAVDDATLMSSLIRKIIFATVVLGIGTAVGLGSVYSSATDASGSGNSKLGIENTAERDTGGAHR